MRRSMAVTIVLVLTLFLTFGVGAVPAVPGEGALGSAPLSEILPGRSSWADARALEPAAGAPTLALAVIPVPEIREMIEQVDSDTLSQYVGDLSGEWPVSVGGEPTTLTTRYTYSGEPIRKATQYVGEHLESLGLDVEYHYWDETLPPNVVGTLPGEAHPDNILILSAHLDSITYQQPLLLAPGADDNASGAATVLLAAEILIPYRWDCTLRFALWTGEEQGLLGSHSYAARAAARGEQILGVLNLDMIGWDQIEGPDVDLHANQSILGSVQLAELFADVVDAYDLTLVPQILPNGTGASDHASFWRYGYAAILGIEDYAPNRHDFNPYYHTEQDLLEFLNTDYFAEFARAAIGTFAHMGCLRSEDLFDWSAYLPLVMQ